MLTVYVLIRDRQDITQLCAVLKSFSGREEEEAGINFRG
jgi:hypothetical protein